MDKVCEKQNVFGKVWIFCENSDCGIWTSWRDLGERAFRRGTPAESKLSGLPGYRMKNKTLAGNYTELVCEVKLTDAALKKIDFLRSIPGVREVTIMNSVSGSVL